MNRLKLFGAVALLGVLACEEATPPRPVGSIVGQVAIEGTGVDGVSVNLSNGNATTTSGGGSFRFDNVEGGAYTITISGYPPDASFDATSAAATISSAGQSVTVNFSGAYIRTANVMGTVTVENMGLSGVTVRLSGTSSATATTDDNGQYAFTGLRMGSYSVEISGFDNDEIGFAGTASAVTVGVGESRIVSFQGTYLRTAGIQGRVSVQGEGVEGVTVSLSGGPDAVDETTTTDAAGQYSFARLRAGDYAVGISGYDTDDYEFEVTSQNVTVALGETANVPFEGVLLRTSGISGRVSVEGMGLADIPVTLSMADAEDMTAMTDAGGLYAFAGLAAGDYMIGIAVESAAYVFETMSLDVTVGDDETAIVNFEGMHARTASVSGNLFIDEGPNGRNDMADEGENLLPHAGVPVVLVGPGVNDRMPSATDSTGAYSFTGLRAGGYQLVVPVTEPLGDYAYGGEPTGYSLSVGVGEAVTQHLPIDITHTTVHFRVTLKHGEDSGDPLAGAHVTLYANPEDAESKVGEGMTELNEETGHAVAAIRIARAGTSGNTVHAGVTAEDYHVADGMTPVMWDPQSTYTMGANANDIVNLNVDVTFGGATISTDYGGGDALGGWAVTVAHGDTMYADTLDAKGMAAFKMTVDSAGALPAMYTFSVDSVQDNKLDGGEKFEGSEVEYTHTGLALAGTMDAGTIEVSYTTQSLVVGTHHERDQVMGYTGNVLGSDERDDGTVELAIRYIDDNGRSRSLTAKEWNPKGNVSSKDGVTTFTGLPADANIIVQASVAEDAGVMLLDPDELAAYTATEANGITGGHFGAHGGYGHTVSLCPLQAESPQDFGECSSFAYVETHTVSGLVWRRSVARSGDAFKETDPDFSDEVSISLTPVEGKNLAGEEQEFDALAKPSKAGRTDDHVFEFEAVAAGAYKLNLPAGWRARTPAGDETATKDATGMLGDALSPLDDDLAIDITPATQTVYGFVTGSDGFGVDGVEVTVNNVTAMTDALGRYIAEGVTAVRGKVFVSTSKAGYKSVAKPDSASVTFAMNGAEQHDITLSGADKTASVSGTATASGTGEGVAGVKIQVDGEDPINAGKNGLLTDDDGSFTAVIPAKGLGETSNLSASKAGYSFQPSPFPVAAHAGANTSGIAFTGFLHGTISGRVRGPDGNALGGVTVTATNAIEGQAGDEVTSTTGGTFSLSVPFGNYTVTATAPEGSLTRFSYPNDQQHVRVAPGQSRNFGTIAGASVAARIIDVERMKDDDGNYVENHVKVTLAWDTVAGFSEIDRYAQTSSDDGENWSPGVDLRVLDEDEYRFSARDYRAFQIRIRTEAEETVDGTTTRYIEDSAVTAVDAVDASPSDAGAERGVGEGADEGDDLLTVTWKASSNRDTHQRILIEVEVAEGRREWLVAEGGDPTALAQDTRKWVLNVTDIQDPSSWSLPDGTGTRNLTSAALLKALKVQVQTRLVPRFRDPHEWVASNTVEVEARE